jgi:hypothetical protein
MAEAERDVSQERKRACDVAVFVAMSRNLICGTNQQPQPEGESKARKLQQPAEILISIRP